jgi:hypothetical protein
MTRLFPKNCARNSPPGNLALADFRFRNRQALPNAVSFVSLLKFSYRITDRGTP